MFGLQETRIALPADLRPLLVTLLAVEEEFDWSADFDRSCTAVSSVERLRDAQRLFDEMGVRPALAVTYPVATQASSAAVIRDLVAGGKADVGAHLHPWVTPPHEESLTRFNSYPGNLPPALERQKLAELVAAIETNIGASPRFYHAGRYGFGPNTGRFLEELGFEVDLSAAPPLDCRDDGGPDFSAMTCEPRWFGHRRALLGVPTTGAFVGRWQSRPDRLYRLLRHPLLSWAHLTGAAARLGLLDRLRLSPEDYAPSDHRRLIEALIGRGHRVFTFYFHSPTLKPGCTDYTRSEDDVRRFLERCRAFFRYFRDEIGGEFVTPTELHARVARCAPPPLPAGHAPEGVGSAALSARTGPFRPA